MTAAHETGPVERRAESSVRAIDANRDTRIRVVIPDWHQVVEGSELGRRWLVSALARAVKKAGSGTALLTWSFIGVSVAAKPRSVD